MRVSGQAWSAEPLQCELRPSQEAVITDVRSSEDQDGIEAMASLLPYAWPSFCSYSTIPAYHDFLQQSLNAQPTQTLILALIQSDADVNKLERGAQVREEQQVMVQAANGEWLRRTQPTRHVRRETRWALQAVDDRPPHTRLPIVGGLKADIRLLRVGASRRRPGSGLDI